MNRPFTSIAKLPQKKRELLALLIKQQALELNWESTGTDRRLVAYVVPKKGSTITTAELTSFLKERLPEYMIPSAVVILDGLPLMPSGKVNRRALPAPGRLCPDLTASFIAPQTPIEKELSQIWAELLGVEQVGIENNFFSLGGHSLLATQLLSRIRKNFDVELTLREFFMSPVINSLAQVVEEAIIAKANSTKLDRMLDMLESMDDCEAEHALAFKTQQDGPVLNDEPDRSLTGHDRPAVCNAMTDSQRPTRTARTKE